MIEVRREGRLDAIEIVVECKPAHAGRAEIERDACERLAQLVKALIGVTAAVRCMPVGAIQRSIGKARRVVDLRPRG